ncbi:hypothetical protein B0J13DRAFT_634335 [Dactylonectria estremocensis]|uniref:RNA ligase domain-containing protein n=1 Tax=Dactylonectria estremocensis TaxID=1079267 RepID=A0A9P9FJZ2_9HYPO|nr:hypothetical protein B0J13DRAFT_634335 [Dactylonectria estremocensis]
MPRKLVTVRRVASLTPIPGADRIETAAIDGWNCVVAVGQFKPGDLGLYFEIDSLLPGSDERWAFLAPKTAGSGDGPDPEQPPPDIRIRTVRIRKAVSQGLLVALSRFPEVTDVMDRLRRELGSQEAMEDEVVARGMSFDDALGVRKFEKTAAEDAAEASAERAWGLGDPAAAFPDFVPKTEQERVQNLPGVFGSHWRDAVFQESAKMDGSSATVYYMRRDSPHYGLLPALPPGCVASQHAGGRVGVCSRNRELGEQNRESPLFWATVRAAGIPDALARCGRNVALQGELCGSSIQANFEGFRPGEHAFFLFAVWDIDTQRYLPPREVHETWAPMLGVRHVAVEGYRPLREIASSVAELVARADGKGIHGRKREGIVLKHVDGNFSFKAISNSYLLKHGE